ncbi:hypothetical protein DBT_2198 [Dissulfuribacter thermophilus]|uniref:YkgJ family cysteine cluster protein n=1 Tax=Dissulfuribacter thermophilus TaxID=1156395 RepID=A0A1B9F3F6_9BACT|nr:YkgJ family cysteine cluster protein [Dissulfuribacter thermophilus]OCC14469.1 hypothetical protein DBT_2198 [Dissulfuribacter thermophilus]
MEIRKICSDRCGALCCREVKRLPYLGENNEVIFSTLLIGALPDIDEPTPERRPFVVEWLIPQEALSCPALTKDNLCAIYCDRPLSCMRFPRVGENELHPFCPERNLALGKCISDPPYLTKRDLLDGLILEAIENREFDFISTLIQENKPFESPLLYNGYFLATMYNANVDPYMALNGQKKVLKKYQEMGNSVLTFIIPDTDYVISCEVEGLLANIEWLEFRVKHDQMFQKIVRALESRLFKG